MPVRDVTSLFCKGRRLIVMCVIKVADRNNRLFLLNVTQLVAYNAKHAKRLSHGQRTLSWEAVANHPTGFGSHCRLVLPPSPLLFLQMLRHIPSVLTLAVFIRCPPPPPLFCRC